MLNHNTHADVITIQETKLTPKTKTPKLHNFTTVCTDGVHKLGGEFIHSDLYLQGWKSENKIARTGEFAMAGRRLLWRESRSMAGDGE